MFTYIQIFLCIVFLYQIDSKPIFGEIGFKKNFEVSYKPLPLLPFRPFGIIKEFWTPFGHFESRHGIAKRDLDSIKPLEPTSSTPESMPLDRYEVEEPKVGPVSFPSTPLSTVPLRPSIGPNIGPMTAISPMLAPPNPVVVITPPTPKETVPIREVPQTGLYTDISRDEIINEYLKSIEDMRPISENNIIPERPKNEGPLPPVQEEPENPIVRGSRLAVYFGNILIDMFSRFLNGNPAGRSR